MKKALLLFAVIISWHCDVFSQTAPLKKYNLFNPIPRDQMREMSTDRPDITESPQSVDAGHFQIETDLFKTIRNKSENITDVSNSYNLANLKLGLTNKMDLQFIVGSFVSNYQLNDDKHKSNVTTSFGDITLRVKYNFWGNDGGKTAFGIMPYVNFPTSTDNEDLEAGVVLPFSVDLGNDFSFGTQLQADWLKSTTRSGYHGSILQSVVVGKEITKSLETFVESYYVYDFESKNFDASFNGGFGYLFTRNLKFDAGFNLGITKNTQKVYFIGFSFRY